MSTDKHLKAIAEEFLLRIRIARTLRLRRRLTLLDEKMSLKERFPQHGHTILGRYDINRYDSDGGVDLKRFMADHAGKKRTQKFFTMMPDPTKIASHAPGYIKPRVEKVVVKEVRLAKK